MLKKYLLICLHLVSIVLLYFGLTLNALKIDISANLFIHIDLFSEHRSVLGTLSSLLETNNYLPFILIGLFGILVPMLKSILLFYVIWVPSAADWWKRVIWIAGKWAMADVFALSIFIAFLGANAMKNTSAILETGFYCFTAYVLLSAVITGFFVKINTSSPSYHP